MSSKQELPKIFNINHPLPSAVFIKVRLPFLVVPRWFPAPAGGFEFPPSCLSRGEYFSRGFYKKARKFCSSFHQEAFHWSVLGCIAFLGQSLQLGELGSANQSPPPPTSGWSRCQHLERAVPVQRSCGFPNGTQSADKTGKRMVVTWPSHSKYVLYSPNCLTTKSELAVRGYADWGNERVKPTAIIIQNQQRMSEMYGSIKNSLNNIMQKYGDSWQGKKKKTVARVIKTYKLLPPGMQAARGIEWDRAGLYGFS